MGRKAQPPPEYHWLPSGDAKSPSPAFPCTAALPCFVLSCESNCFSFSLTLACMRGQSWGAPAAAPCLRGSAMHSRACVQLAQLHRCSPPNSRPQHCNEIFSINLGPRGKWCGEGEWSGRLGPTNEATARQLQRHCHGLVPVMLLHSSSVHSAPQRCTRSHAVQTAAGTGTCTGTPAFKGGCRRTRGSAVL